MNNFLSYVWIAVCIVAGGIGFAATDNHNLILAIIGLLVCMWAGGQAIKYALRGLSDTINQRNKKP